jgi:hypothetical protein
VSVSATGGRFVVILIKAHENNLFQRISRLRMIFNSSNRNFGSQGFARDGGFCFLKPYYFLFSQVLSANGTRIGWIERSKNGFNPSYPSDPCSIIFLLELALKSVLFQD